MSTFVEDKLLSENKKCLFDKSKVAKPETFLFMPASRLVELFPDTFADGHASAKGKTVTLVDFFADGFANGKASGKGKR